MKIAIYDKWLNALGGGEKVATVMAEILSKKNHEVDLISNFEADKKQIEEKMGVDLSKVNLHTWYERSYEKLSPLTKKYDLFLNLSYLDHLPSLARKSAYYIHFPTPLKTTILGFIKYEKILPFLRRFLIIPEIQNGIKPVDDIYTRAGRWLNKENVIIFSNTPMNFKITIRIFAEKLNLSTLNSITFSSTNSTLHLTDRHIDHGFNVLVFNLEVSCDCHSPVIKIYISEDLKSNGLGLVSLTVKNYRFLIWNFIKRYMPRYEIALYGSSSFKVDEGLDTYKQLFSNSEFTRRWTRKYWARKSQVLYPPVDVAQFKPGRKRNIILNVGRFFVGGHSKKQDVLAAAFKKMIDRKLIDNTWELHFVGGIAGGKEHTDYLRKIQEVTKGYPVHFHISASYKELIALYSKAKIYWHATGYGVKENEEPIKFEHFGITVVEAMAAGAVPVVYQGGGLTETVTNNGFTWKTPRMLIKKTVELISDKKLWEQMTVKSIENAQKFSRQEFSIQLLRHVDDLIEKK